MFAETNNSKTMPAETIKFSPGSSSAMSSWQNVAMREWNGNFKNCNITLTDEPFFALQLGGDNLAVGINGLWAKEQSYPGSLTFLPPSKSATYQLDGRNVRSLSAHLSLRCFDTEVIGIPGDLVNKLYFQCGFKDDFLTAGILSLAEEMKNPTEVGSLYADSIATSLGMHMLRKCLSTPPKPVPQLISQRGLRIALDLLEASVETGISLDEVAKEVGLSRSHFAKAFKRSIGLAPHSYLTAKRIDRARELLSGTDEKIAEIAIRCGFSSQAHFCDSFRRATGVTPMDFRRRKN